MANEAFDVCVVGSGPGGGIATWVLADKGLNVALVEPGPRLRAGVDFNSHGTPFQQLERRLQAGYRTPVPNLFADRRERNHFVAVGDRPDHGLLRAPGGRSLCWAGHSLRFGPLDFRRWPIRYPDVAPYYSRAERWACFLSYAGATRRMMMARPTITACSPAWIGDRPNPRFEGTYQVQCGAGLHPNRIMIRDVPGYGASLQAALRELNATHAGMNMQGSLLVSAKKRVDLDPSRKDRFGLALPRVHLRYEDSDLAMAQDCVNTCEEIIRSGGGRVFSTPGTVTAETLQIDYNPWVGTAKTGDDPRTSVVDRWSRTHDVPNLFIGDASVFADYPEKDPTLTNIALCWRMAEHLAALARKGELGAG